MFLTWRSAIDFLTLCAAFYIVLRWASLARALRLSLSIVGLYAASLVAREFNLVITGWLLAASAYVVMALVVVLFQPELRRALLQIDARFFQARRPGNARDSVLAPIAAAAFSLAAQGLGALVVLVRRDSIDELIDGGVSIGGDVTAPLLEALFQKPSPLHDGAAVVSHGQLVRANVILPLTQRRDVPFEYGTRHRAAMGIAERSDAIAIAVSEERTQVTLFRGSERRILPSAEALAIELGRSAFERKQSVRSRIHGLLFSRWRLKVAAIALGSAVWVTALLLPGNIVRTVHIPVEFADVPRGLDIGSQSATAVDAQLRGRTWAMDALAVPALVARFNLRDEKAGVRTIRVTAAALDLPPGVTLIAVQPSAITVKLIARNRT